MVGRLANYDRWSLAGFACLMLAGCAALPKRGFVPEVNPATLDDTAFIHYLASVPTVTIAEGTRGVLLLRGATGQWPTYAEQRSELSRIGAMKLGWGLADDDTLDMGTLGYMLRAICDFSPSVSQRIARVTGLGERRYALRRCLDAGILPYTNANQPVRGGELVAAIAKAEKFVDTPAPPPTDEPDEQQP